MRLSVRGFVCIAAIAFVACAQATTVDLISVGTYNNSFGPYYTTSETLIYSDLASQTVGGSLAFYDQYTPNTGTATYTSGGNTLVLDVTVTNFDTDPGGGLTSSMVGTWTLDTALSSAVYQGLIGSGTISAGYNGQANAFSATTVVGNLLVPEPASYAVLGLGLLGILRRRNRR